MQKRVGGDGTRRALLAIHAVYDEKKRPIAADMETLHAKLNPHLGIVSAQRRSKRLAHSVWPFESANEHAIDPVFRGPLQEITKFRMGIREEFGQLESIIQTYLREEVLWQWSKDDVVVLSYKR